MAGSSAPDKSPRLSAQHLGWVGALALATALRVHRVGPQLLVGDELHTIRAAGSLSVAEILRTWSFEGADYCVPLTAAFRWLGDHGVALSEWMMRGPGLLAGLVAVAAIPLAVKRVVGARAALALAWLLACSPMLVLYSRIVRSYMPAVLLSALAVIACERFLSSGRRTPLAVYAVLGGAAVWFHLGTAPLVAAAAGVGLGAAGWKASRGQPWRPLARRAVTAGASLAVCVALVLLPARASLVELSGAHGSGTWPDATSLLETLRLLGGTRNPFVLALLLAVAGRGTWLLARSRPGLLAATASLGGLQVLGLLVLAPNWLDHPLVMSRYLLVLLPFALTLVAVGALGLEPPATPRARRVGVGAAFAGLAILVAAGPFTNSEGSWTSFAHAPPFLGLAGEPDRIPPAELPRFYLELAEQGGAVLEMPWANSATHALRVYQGVHRQELRVAPAAPRFTLGPRWRLRNFVAPAPEAVLSSDARWLVLHRDWQIEEARVITAEPLHTRRLAEAQVLWEGLRRAASRAEPELRAALGRPFHESAEHLVFDLARVRRARAAGGADPESVLP